MNRLLLYLICFLFAGSTEALLVSCGNWETPGKKSQRNCVKPSGNLDAQAQQRKVNFSITNSSGTIDKVIWDFGNGSSSVTTGMTTTYTYPVSNTYTVKATLTNGCGIETTIVRSIVVSDAIVPTVNLQPATDLSLTSSTLRVTITSFGNATITRYGVCYSPTSGIPTIDDIVADNTVIPTLNAPVSFSLTNLLPNTLYYVRAFAINSAGTGYSSPIQTFQTGLNPSITIDSIRSNITTANVSFSVTTLGNPPVTEYGICYASNVTVPDITNAPHVSVANPSVGSNLVSLSSLIPNTKYYYRLYTKIGPATPVYGNVSFFTTNTDPVSQDLIASVSFNNQSLLDVSGYNNNVKLVDNPTFTTDHNGKANSAILLDGVNDYFYMPENSNNSLNPDALSVSIWIKPASLTKRMQVYNKSRYEDSAFETYSALMKLENDIGPNITILTDIKQNSGCQPGKGWQDFPFTSKIQLNEWYHLVFTYSGRTARMYLNGLKLYTSDDLPANSMDKCPGAELKFGAAIKGLDWFFNGAMDDIRIYKRALSDSEVQTLRNQ